MGTFSLNPQGHLLKGAILYVMENEIMVHRIRVQKSVLAEHGS